MMDKNERKPHFSIIDSLIDSSDPLRAEYFRGYQRGIVAQVFGVSDGWIEDHRVLIDYSIVGSGDSYIDSYAQGYHDGYKGKTPESPSESFRSHNIASIV